MVLLRFRQERIRSLDITKTHQTVKLQKAEHTHGRNMVTEQEPDHILSNTSNFERKNNDERNYLQRWNLKWKGNKESRSWDDPLPLDTVE